jgi:uncharacterized protein (TIGR01777 family)
MSRLIACSRLPVSPAEVFAWHERPGALARLTPPWEKVRVVESTGSIHDGDRTVLEMRVGPLRRRWVAEHGGFVDGERFEDRQRSGPFRAWHHIHRVEPEGDGALLTDEVEYALPLGGLGRALAAGWVRRKLERMFGYRHRVLLEDLRRHRGRAPLRIAISGASGLVGSALSAFLSTGGHQILPIKIRAGLDAAALEGIDAFVHLAGESVAARWTPERKQKIRESRTQGTRLVAETLARLARPPRVLVSASAIGIYGDVPSDQPVDERAASGDGFLAGVCREWEAAAEPAARAGIRVVHPRIGVVLTPSGGALGKMLPAFRAGVAGRIGSGRQGMSWIALDDLVYAILHLIGADDLRGPVNLVAPHAASNADFTRTVAGVLHRPAVMPLPSLMVKTLFGQMGREMLLAGAMIAPRRLAQSGFAFAYPELEGALRHLLGRAPEPPPGFQLT